MRYEIDDDPGRVDVDVVWTFLSTEAYWNRWRTRPQVEQQVTGAWRLVGAYSVPDGGMVGFARAVSDGVNIAYLADVFVLSAHRGKGLGKQLVSTMIDNGPGTNFRWFLATRDGHSFYEQFGFATPDMTAMVRPGTPPSPTPVTGDR